MSILVVLAAKTDYLLTLLLHLALQLKQTNFLGSLLLRQTRALLREEFRVVSVPLVLAWKDADFLKREDVGPMRERLSFQSTVSIFVLTPAAHFKPARFSLKFLYRLADARSLP